AGRAVPGVSWEGDEPAILYLPGVARETLRAAEECPTHLRLLAWLVVGGSTFGHPNGRDWTLRGFLSAKTAYGGLGLDVAQDEATRVALLAAGPKLFAMSLAELRNRRLDAPWLHSLLAPDLAEDTLAWLGGRFDAKTDPVRFAAFCARAKAELKMNPAKVKPGVAAQRLLKREKGWDAIWNRFAQGGPGFHEDAAALLAAQDSPDGLFVDPTVYAAANASAEHRLRAALLALADKPGPTVRDEICALAKEHAARRSGPWAARGQSPLAFAVAHLATLATTPPLPVADAVGLAAAYAAEGWRADWAALAALAATAPAGSGAALHAAEDRTAVTAALRALYAPRLHRDAEALQTMLRDGVPQSPPPAKADIVLFVDGLRMDLAQRLAAMVRDQGAAADVSWRWAGFPTVTATCKPLASPAAGRFKGAAQTSDFYPSAADDKLAEQAILLREMAELGWRAGEVLLESEAGWVERGYFDRDGHDQQSRMVDRLESELASLAGHVLRLARSGRRVRIATDHGWILLPGGLPVAKLEAGLTETKWARCAVIKDGAATTASRLPWSWNPAVSVATAPGAHAFRGGQDYAHGGISPQEVIVPEILVAPLAAARRATIVTAEWSGLRLRLQADGGDGLIADILLGSEGEDGSVVARALPLDAEGKTALLVPNDLLEGKTALLVLRVDGGAVVASRSVVIGGS
ncbi:MAG: BREX-1 system phosphatase PglZ type B, partial [Rhodospirillales bacterium]|nr:BREX-1 system phosphatase PglZ type B [Rhodospirillales bacterium]